MFYNEKRSLRTEITKYRCRERRRRKQSIQSLESRNIESLYIILANKKIRIAPVVIDLKKKHLSNMPPDMYRIFIACNIASGIKRQASKDQLFRVKY